MAQNNLRCHIICYNLRSDEALEKILEIRDRPGLHCDKFHLEFEKISFPEHVINGSWLGDKFIAEINQITISDNIIYDIYPDGFHPKIVSKALAINLNGLRVRSLRYGVFRNFKSLIQIMFERVGIFQLDFNVFAMNSELTRIIISDSNEYKMKLIGTNDTNAFKKLKSLSIFNSNLPKTLDRNSLVGFPILEKLRLSEDRIESLSKGVFASLPKTIDLISLANNKIKTLSASVLHPLFSETGPSPTVELHLNPFHCDENLLDLKNLIIKTKFKILRATCFSPKEFERILVANANIEGTEAPSTSTQPSAPTIPSKPTGQKVSLTCKRLSVSIVHLSIMQRKQLINIRKKMDGTFRIFISYFTNKYNLIWFENEITYERNITSKPKIGCYVNQLSMSPYKKEFDKIIENGKYYTVCIVPRQDKNVQPLNCMSFSVGRSINIEAWVKKKYQIACVFIAVGIGLLSISIGVIILIVLSKKFPKFRTKFQKNKIYDGNKR